ncbi:hypothetical protein LCGC14_2331700, partial [marine sediment metagenome]
DPPVDVYALLKMSRELCYHKHLLLSAGLLLARGRIVCFCDSDAMVRPSFVQSIIEHFEAQPGTVLHHDEVRNNNERFYPFGHPDFDDVIGEGAINWTGTTTTGIVDTVDPLHTRNYGACMSAKRRDLIAVGGADEHTDYLGHICGPYGLTFRLVNYLRRERWHESEFIYHVWHPGQAGDNNFGGPHDGRHMSTRALDVRRTGLVRPAVENDAILMLRTKAPGWRDESALREAVINDRRAAGWVIDQTETETAGADSWGHHIKLREIKFDDADAPPPSSRRTRATSALPSMDSVVYSRRPDRAEPILRASTKLRLVPVLVGLVLRQMFGLAADPGVKMPRGGPLRRMRRLTLRQMYWIRRYWHRLCVAYLNGADEITLYGGDGFARVGRILSRDLPLTITRIIPAEATKHDAIAGCRALRPDQARYVRGYVLLTSLRGTREAYRRLAELQVPKERVMPLR